jgi:hypothetical protein
MGIDKTVSALTHEWQTSPCPTSQGAEDWSTVLRPERRKLSGATRSLWFDRIYDRMDEAGNMTVHPRSTQGRHGSRNLSPISFPPRRYPGGDLHRSTGGLSGDHGGTRRARA